MDIFVAEFLTPRKVRQTLRVALQYISEADLSKLLWLDLAPHVLRARSLYPMYRPLF